MIFFSLKMIKKHNLNTGINANLSLEPNASSNSQSTNNINNNIIINKREDGKEDIIITREVELEGVTEKEERPKDVKGVILETFAQILLDQDKALLSNLISKRCIIVPATALAEIIKVMIGAEEVEVYLEEEDGGCCATKLSPIRKIEAIKIYSDSGEIITDFKQCYNKQFNELVNNYHVSLKYAVNS